MGKSNVVAGGRDLHWDGCWNVRDLGGLPTRDGRTTARGAVVRGDDADGLSTAGWRAVEAHGIRTVVDLRNDGEERADALPRPPGVGTIRAPVDGVEDREFWDAWSRGPGFATPLYYRAHLERFPQRNASAVAAVAHAPPGGVLVHCQGGRDRTGQIVMLLLALVGVAPEVIAADYAISAARLPARYAALGREDEYAAIGAFLADHGRSAEQIIVDMLESFDVEDYIRAAGLGDDDLAALRARLVP